MARCFPALEAGSLSSGPDPSSEITSPARRAPSKEGNKRHPWSFQR